MSNIDLQEINKFDSLAASWWDTQGESKALHAINPLRLSFIERYCRLKNQKIIDVGCGGGILSESMAQADADVLGIDMAEHVLHVARDHAAKTQTPVRYEQLSAEQAAGKYPQQFDVATCMELLEHVPDPVSVVKACADLVKADGYVFFSTLNRNLKSFMQAIVGAEYLLKLIPKGTHSYEKFIRPSELAGWARDAGLSTVGITGITYHPLTREYHLTENTDVNYIMCFKK